MKSIVIKFILLFSLFLTSNYTLLALTNGSNNQETSDYLWQNSNPQPSPEPSYLPGDPGIPEVPIDNHIIVLLLAVILYSSSGFIKNTLKIKHIK